MRILVIIILFALGLGECAIAQDPQFTQIQSVPLYLNPAFTGLNQGARYALNYRRQFAGIPGGFASFGASADFNLSQANSGLGVAFLKDVAGVTKLSQTGGSVYYSHRVRLGRTKWINAGMRFGFIAKSFDLNSILLADQIVRDNAPVTLESSLVEQSTNFDFGFGLVYNTDNFWVGFALDHLIEPDLSLQEAGDAKTKMKFSIHSGGVIWSDGSYKNKEQIKLAAQYKKSGTWDQFDLGLTYHMHKLYGGLFYRGIPFQQYRKGLPGHDAIAVILGVKIEGGLKIGYSYDVTVSSLTQKSGGSHEMSVVFTQFKAQRKRIKIPPCMEF